MTRHEDSTLGMRRIEITCTACGGHLGHVFKGEGFGTPSKFDNLLLSCGVLIWFFFLVADERHCVNSVSLKFDEGKGQ